MILYTDQSISDGNGSSKYVTNLSNIQSSSIQQR